MFLAHGRIYLVRIICSWRRIPWLNKILFFKFPPSLGWIFFCENFFVHNGLFPGWIKFYFTKAPHPHGIISLVIISFWSWLRIYWYNIIFIFQRPPPRHVRISFVIISLVTTAYSLVESNFIFQRLPPLTGEFHWWEFLLSQRRISWLIQILFSKGPPPYGRISLGEFLWSRQFIPWLN